MQIPLTSGRLERPALLYLSRMNRNESPSPKEFAHRVVNQLRESGFDAYFAGGCVRDQLLGRNPKDYDVATSARPDQVRAVFGRRQTLAIGASFGVITVVGPKSAGQIDVATFRNDGVYSDGRHPDAVNFSTAKEDARRRDFTINGMFFDPIDETVIDYVDGQADLDARVIRAIGNPLQRIAEDKLRMMRAVRFAVTYGFEIDVHTMAAIQQRHDTIISVSQERITHELELMLVHPARVRALRLLTASHLLPHILPELQPLAVCDDGSAAMRILQALNRPDFSLVLAAMLGPTALNLGVAEASAFCRRLRLSNQQRRATAWMVEHEAQLRIADQLMFSELQPLLLHPDISCGLALAQVVAEVRGESMNGIQRCQTELRRPAVELDPPPLLRGDDLTERGYAPGPNFAKVLRDVRNAQLDGQIRTKAAALELAQRELSHS